MATKCQRPQEVSAHEEEASSRCSHEEAKGEQQQQFVEPAGVINQSHNNTNTTIDDDSHNKTNKGNNNKGIHNKSNNNKNNKTNNNELLNNHTRQEPASAGGGVAKDRRHDEESGARRPSYQFLPNSGADTQQSNQINLHTLTTTTTRELRRTSTPSNTTPTRAPTATCLTSAVPPQQPAVTKKLALHRTRSAPPNCLHHEQQQEEEQQQQQHHEYEHQLDDEHPRSSIRNGNGGGGDYDDRDERDNSDAGHGNGGDGGEAVDRSAKKAAELERNGVFEVIQIPEKQRFGCAHYKRRAMFVTPCCQKFYNCRFCHDENEEHHFDRKTLTELICSECNTRQKVQERCEACGVRFGKYTCLICNLFDDSDKQQYHCDACGICRIGGAENFFHCAVCDMCLPIQLKIDGHRCVENVSRSHCPVCLGDIHTSRIPCHIPDCGHLLHKMCFDQLLDSGHYTCPTCQTSLMDMTALWEYLDQQALLMPIPHKYENQRIHIFCNDCHQTSKTKFHYIGLKCLQCGAYNTTQDVKRRMSLVTDEPSSA